MLLLESPAASNGTSKLFLGASKPVSVDELKNEYSDTNEVRYALRLLLTHLELQDAAIS